MSEQHSPLPWQISPVRTTENTAMIVGGEGFEFGLIADVTEDRDAAFIVRAANNHEMLVEALKSILNASNDPYEIARAALAACSKWEAA